MIKKYDRTEPAFAHHLAKAVLEESVNPCVQLRAEANLQKHWKGIGQTRNYKCDQDVALICFAVQEIHRENEWHERGHLAGHHRQPVLDAEALNVEITKCDPLAICHRGCDRAEHKQSYQDLCRCRTGQEPHLPAIHEKADREGGQRRNRFLV